MKKLLLAVSVLFMSAAFCACGSSGSVYTSFREIEEIQVIQTLGIDWHDGQVEVSAASGSSEGGMSSTIISCTGDSIVTAMEKLQSYSSREELYYAHVKYILIGQSAAERGIGEYLDFVARYPEMRLDTTIFIVKGGDAKALVTGTTPDGKDITDSISSLSEDIEHNGNSAVFSCRELVRSLSENGAAVICAVEAKPTDGIVFPSPSGSGSGQESGSSGGSDSGSEGGGSGGDGGGSAQNLAAISDGFAVIRDGALCGFIPPEISKGVCILLGRAGAGITTLTDSDGNTVTVQFDDSKADYTFAPGKVSFNISVSAGILELSGDADITDPQYIAQLDSRFTEKVKGWVDTALEMSREMDADFLGLGSHIGIWKLTDGKDLRSMLSEVDFETAVDGYIERSYDMTDSTQESADR